MEWINVKDELPKAGVSVLCVAKPKHSDKFVIRVYYMYDEEKQKYYGSKIPLFREDCTDQFRWETTDVTYWMPLPKLP